MNTAKAIKSVSTSKRIVPSMCMNKSDPKLSLCPPAPANEQGDKLANKSKEETIVYDFSGIAG